MIDVASTRICASLICTVALAPAPPRRSGASVSDSARSTAGSAPAASASSLRSAAAEPRHVALITQLPPT
eukprot:1034419-Prymnesium_polylepis.2